MSPSSEISHRRCYCFFRPARREEKGGAGALAVSMPNLDERPVIDMTISCRPPSRCSSLIIYSASAERHRPGAAAASWLLI